MPFDYKLDATDDLAIESGDFVVSESTKQHQGLLVRSKKGELRQFGKTGVGIDDFLLDENPGDVYPEIQKQFEADGMVIRALEVKFSDDQTEINVSVDAYYP